MRVWKISQDVYKRQASETTIIALTRQFILASACFYIPLTGVNVVRFCIQGMGFSVFAISAGILEMIGRAFAAIILIPSIGFMGACLASPIAWIAADAFLFPAFIHCAKKLNADVYKRQECNFLF